jgi:hypothetical protein
VSIQALSPADAAPTVPGISRMTQRQPLPESLRLFARLHVDLRRLASAICQA